MDRAEKTSLRPENVCFPDSVKRSGKEFSQRTNICTYISDPAEMVIFSYYTVHSVKPHECHRKIRAVEIPGTEDCRDILLLLNSMYVLYV